MKRIFLFAIAVVLYGCGCLAQIPTQYVYVDDDCSGVLPDYLNLVVVSDNCEIASIIQTPPPGQIITDAITVQIRAADAAGNASSAYFNVVLLDTIAPLIQLNPAWSGYTIQEIGDMYKVYYGWVQELGDLVNEKVTGTTDSIYIGDTLYTHYNDTMRLFYGTIPITDPRFRIDQGYWSGEDGNDLDLTALWVSLTGTEYEQRND